MKKSLATVERRRDPAAYSCSQPDGPSCLGAASCLGASCSSHIRQTSLHPPQKWTGALKTDPLKYQVFLSSEPELESSKRCQPGFWPRPVCRVNHQCSKLSWNISVSSALFLLSGLVCSYLKCWIFIECHYYLWFFCCGL